MFRCLALSLLALLIAPAAFAAENYQLGPDSQRQEGVPRGKVEKFSWTSEIFKETVRDCWVYIPSQYDGKTPACIMVFQDGSGYVDETGGWRVPIVFDNLIAKKEMPVTVGIFLNPGEFQSNTAADGRPVRGKSNRSVEYDSLGGDYAKFLIDEILPEVTKRYSLKLTDDPDGRAISGLSSGGICSFTVAWERPDAFRKVASFIGSFTNIRGGGRYPELILAADKKPIRVFLQDGKADLKNKFGSWFEANQAMAAALKKKEYDYKFVEGEGGHTSKHGASIFPDTLRWLWRDYKPKE
jgi:enterochelin esterase-like enzyme